MQNSNDQNYYLFDVPGIDDKKLEEILGKLIEYPKGIKGVCWWKPAVGDNGGAVRLQLDETAAKLFRERQDELYVGNKRIFFVDKGELPIKAMSTIDDDIVQLVQKELIKDGSKEKWTEIVGGLNFTPAKHEEGYDYWRIEGTFAGLKKFEAQVRDIIFKGAISQPISVAMPPKKIQNKRRRSRIRSVNKDDASDSADETMRSGDDELQGGPDIHFTAGDMGNTVSKLVNLPKTHINSVKKTILTSKFYVDAPLRLEFYVGDISKEEGVKAIVNPTDFLLKADTNPISKSISLRMGEQNYESITKKMLEEQWGSITTTFAVMTGAGNLNVRNIIHVIMPPFGFGKADILRKLACCYGSCFKKAMDEHLTSISFPPLGIESGIDTETASYVAMNTLMEYTTDNANPLLGVDVIRFIFTDEQTMQKFLKIFCGSFEITVQRA